VQALLEHGSDPNICPSEIGSSSYDHVVPPLSAVASCGKNALVRILIKFGARLDHADSCGRTALHFAIMESTKNDTSTAEILLLSAGADANVMDKYGYSPLYLACERGKTELVNLLLSRGANPTTGTIVKYPIHAACRGQYYDSVKLLLEYNVCLCLCPYNRSKTAETTITELTIGIVHSIMSPGYQFNIWSKDQFTGSQSAKTFQAIDGRRKL